MAEQRLDRRSFLAGAAGVATAAAQTPDARQRPNILHIMTDQQQWATIAGRSGCRTPNLDRLAREGMLFERSYTPSAVCCPAPITGTTAYTTRCTRRLPCIAT